MGRTSANTANPGSDTTGWELIGSAADLSSLSDDNLNAIGGASFGGNFQGTWEAGIFAVGNVVYHGGFFYESTVARRYERLRYRPYGSNGLARFRKALARFRQVLQ